MQPEELYNSANFLPKEMNNDWFEVVPDSISVKNKHLISITRPISINTIGTSLKNSSWDLRACPVNPKTVISPWLQSSIEPATATLARVLIPAIGPSRAVITGTASASGR